MNFGAAPDFWSRRRDVKIPWNLRFRCQFFRPTLPRVPRPQLRQFTRLSNSDIWKMVNNVRKFKNWLLNFFTLLTNSKERFFLLSFIQQNIFSIISHIAEYFFYYLSYSKGSKIFPRSWAQNLKRPIVFSRNSKRDSDSSKFKFVCLKKYCTSIVSPVQAFTLYL